MKVPFTGWVEQKSQYMTRLFLVVEGRIALGPESPCPCFGMTLADFERHSANALMTVTLAPRCLRVPAPKGEGEGTP